MIVGTVTGPFKTHDQTHWYFSGEPGVVRHSYTSRISLEHMASVVDPIVPRDVRG